MSQKKGNFVLKNAAGVVTLAGRAALTNNVTSNAIRDTSPIEEHTDALGVPRTLTKNYDSFEMSLTLIPGIGAALSNKSAVQAVADLVPIGSTIVTSGFDIDSANWPSNTYGTVRDCTVNLTSDGLLTMNVTCRRIYDLGNSAWVDLTASWASL